MIIPYFFSVNSIDVFFLSGTEPKLSLLASPECLANLDIGLYFGSESDLLSFLMGASVPVAVLPAQGLLCIASFEFHHSYWSAMSNVRKSRAYSFVTSHQI